MNTAEKTAINSNGELEGLATGNVGVIVEYAFQNPDSINGPFGTMEIVIKENGGSESASGEIKINTLWGLGSVTDLKFNGTAEFNPSTGYTTVVARGQGTITVRPNPPRYIAADIKASLEPGFHEGTLSVQGFFQNFTIKATSIKYIKE